MANDYGDSEEDDAMLTLRVSNMGCWPRTAYTLLWHQIIRLSQARLYKDYDLVLHENCYLARDILSGFNVGFKWMEGEKAKKKKAACPRRFRNAQCYY